MKVFIAVDEAESLIRERTGIMPPEPVPLDDALRRTLATEIVSAVNVPPFDNSAMDGYAVRVADLPEIPVTLPVSQQIPAGTQSHVSLVPGTCARIMTGAPIPDGADAVVPVEWTVGEDHVTFRQAPRLSHSIRSAGEDVRAGEIVFAGGELITPPVVGMLAAMGVSEVHVRRQPTCAVIATGDELVPHEREPGPGQIRNSNGPAIAAQCTSTGGLVVQSSLATDDLVSLKGCLAEALNADVVVMSGGVSVGDYDLVQEALKDMGVELVFWKVRQRPGKPLLFGTHEGTLVFGLPGNPVSSSICFDRYVRPAIARMLGRRRVDRPRRLARLAEPLTKVAGLRYFARGRIEGGVGELPRVIPAGPQGSAIYSSMAHADCLIHLPEDLENPEPGTEVEVELLTW